MFSWKFRNESERRWKNNWFIISRISKNLPAVFSSYICSKWIIYSLHKNMFTQGVFAQKSYQSRHLPQWLLSTIISNELIEQISQIWTPLTLTRINHLPKANELKRSFTSDCPLPTCMRVKRPTPACTRVQTARTHLHGSKTAHSFLHETKTAHFRLFTQIAKMRYFPSIFKDCTRSLCCRWKTVLLRNIHRGPTYWKHLWNHREHVCFTLRVHKKVSQVFFHTIWDQFKGF